MKIIKSILTVYLLLAFLPAMSQKLQYVQERIRYLPQKYDCPPEHEIRAGIGAFPKLSNFFTGSYAYFVEDIWIPSVKEKYKLADNIPKEFKTTGAITVSYSYRFKTWLEVGGAVTYWGIYGKLDKLAEPKKSSNFHSVFVMPTVRFVYYTSEYVRLYSGFSAGLGVVLTTNTMASASSAEFAYTANAVLFGITAGKKLFGFSEISYGAMGFVTAGIGYRFTK